MKPAPYKIINATLSAMIVGVLMILSSSTVVALSAKPIAVVSSAPSPLLLPEIQHAQSGQYNGQYRHSQYQNRSEQKRAIRSRSEVIQEVKRRHRGAEVLKIALNRSGTQYNVRVLMPSGKVRSLQVSALR